MECKTVIDNIELFKLNGLEKSLHAEIEAHMLVCGKCRAESESFDNVLSSITKTGCSESAAPEFMDKLKNTAKQEIEILRKKRSAPAFYDYAKVAVVLLVFVSGIFLLSRSFVGSKGDLKGFMKGAWVYKVDSSCPISAKQVPSISNGKIFIVEKEAGINRLASIDAKSGKRSWSADVSSCGFIVSDDKHVFTISSNIYDKIEITAFSAEAGKMEWKQELNRQFIPQLTAAPAVWGHYLYFNSGTSIEKIDANTGNVLWQKKIRGGSNTVPVIGGGFVFAVSNEKLDCINNETGEIIWSRALIEGGVILNPKLSHYGQNVFVSGIGTDGSDFVVCLNSADGALAWEKKGIKANQITADSEKLYIRDGESVFALDSKDGKTLWQAKAQGCSPLTKVENLICYSDAGETGSIIGLDEKTGKTAFSYKMPKSCSGISVYNDMGFVSSIDGNIYALDIARRAKG